MREEPTTTATGPPDLEPPERSRFAWPRLAKWAGGILAALILLVAAVLIFLNTGPGKRTLVRQISSLELASGLRVEIGRIEGSIYGDMIIHDLVLRDTRGVFLVSPRVHLDWRPFAYLNNHVLIHDLSSPLVVLVRPPELRPTPADPDAPLLPDLDIDIDRLLLQKVLIGKAVTGRSHQLTLGGAVHIADGRARIIADASADSGDRLALRLDAVPEEDRLDINGRLQAPADGLVASLSGLDEPVSVSITGAGRWQRWQGRLRAQSGGRQLAALDIRARDGRFMVNGPVRPGLILEGPVARLTSPALQLDLTADLEERRADLQLQLTSDALAISAEGLVDLGKNRFDHLNVNARLLTPGSIAENLSGRDVRATFILDGDFATPFIAYDIIAERLVFDETGVQGLRASGRAEVDAKRILIPVKARAQRITGLDNIAGGALRDVRIEGDFAYAAGKLISENLKIDSDRLDATAFVLADFEEGIYRGLLEGRLNNYRIEGFGIVSVTADLDLEAAGDDGFQIDGRFGIRTARLDNATVRDMLGGQAVLTGRVAMTPRGDFILSRLKGRSPEFTLLSGRGRYGVDGAVSLDIAARSARYGPLSFTVRGTAEDPEAVLRAARPGLGVQLRDLVARIESEATGYRVEATGETAYGPLFANVLIDTGPGPLTVNVSRARFAGMDLQGRLRQTPAGPFAGRLRMSGSGIEGTVRLAGVGESQGVDLVARANNARLPGDLNITIGRAVVDASLVLYDTPHLFADARIANATYGDWVLRRARAKVDYSGGRGHAQLVADGSSGTAFSLAANAALLPERYVVALNGSAGGVDFRLERPATIRERADGFIIEPATLVLPQGNVRFAGRLGDRSELESRFEDFDLAIVNIFVPGLGIGGRATGSLDYARTGGAFPTADAQIRIADFTRSSLSGVSEPVDIRFRGTLSPAGSADARALIRKGGTTIGRLVATMDAAPGGDAWTDRLARAPLDGGVRYNGPADVLFSFAGQSDQQLTGPVALAANFSGSLRNPRLTGLVRARNLVYENETFGTRVTRITLDGRFTNDRLVLTAFNGRAGEGTVRASGTVGLAAADGFPVNVKVDLNRARLARSEKIGTTVSGDLSITNSPAEAAIISGNLRLPELRYRIVREGSAEVTHLTGVHRKGEPVRVESRADRSPPSMWKLDIRVRADNQIFVTGMGLESEWEADLRIAGTTAHPRIIGELELVRGTYSFAGRRFTLDEGEIDFTGGELANPVIRISASTTVENIEAILNISGRAQNPQIAFTSSPSLPQDEVLSRILFGESIGNLSTFQAIQLAASLNTLSGGGGGGLNPLGQLQSASGIDRLQILGSDPATGRGTAIAAGQYLTNDVYVQIITDARGFTATQLEVALTKALSVLTQTGGAGGTSVNLRYSKDY